MEQGDWKCSCGEINFKKRDNCRKCHKPKGRSGDWNCLLCGELNFASRTSCRKCNNPKQGTTSTTLPNNLNSQPKITMKFGDWICPNNACNEHNFKIRDICRKCNTPKTAQGVTNSNGVDDDISNLCIVCLDQPRTHAIVKCGHLCYCGICGFNINKCPVCREAYNPDKDLLKIYNI